ncbi:MAG: hypothetical protein Q8L86_12480 [Vicinamibacterales bacterium]|nr:hypothetical protein [Vicinamibacterales bacterium]
MKEMASPEKPKPITTEESERSREDRFADKSIAVACQQLEAGLLFKQPRMSRIKEIEEMYAIKQKPALAGRFNIPFDGVIMRGYVESIMAKVDEAPALRFKNTKEASLKGARKITAAAEFELGSSRSNYNQKDRWAKKLGILSGRAIIKAFGESDPVFKFHVSNVDHYDFVSEPFGGGDLEDHEFKFQQNIFKTREALYSGARSGLYDAKQVRRLTTWQPPKENKEVQDEHKNKVSRFATLGLDPESHSYVGTQMFNLTEADFRYRGKRYYALFDSKSKIWVRFVEFKEVFESDLSPWVTWAPDDDAFGFWNLGPCDTMFPIAEGRRINLNAMLNNARKIADDMTLYDILAVVDPSKLMYRPDGLVGVKLREGQALGDVVKKMAPNDITNLAIRIEQFMNNFAGQMTGVTPSAQGQGNEQLAAILESNIQQVSDRIGLINKSYTLGQEQIGRRFDWSLWEHAPEDYMVKTIGSEGAEWDAITKEDKDPDYEVVAVSARAEQEQSAAKAEKQEKALSMVVSNEHLLSVLSPKATVQEILRFGGFEEDKIRVLTSLNDEADEEILSEAARLIDACLQGEPVDLFPGANTAFVQKIMDFAQKMRIPSAEKDKKGHAKAMKQYMKLMALAEMHVPIMQENMARKAMLEVPAATEPAVDPATGQPLAPAA